MPSVVDKEGYSRKREHAENAKPEGIAKARPLERRTLDSFARAECAHRFLSTIEVSIRVSSCLKSQTKPQDDRGQKSERRTLPTLQSTKSRDSLN